MRSRKKLQVFISSTYKDLKKERQAAVEAVLKAKHIPAGMELFTAGDETQLNTIKKWINESDVYLLILGGRYGSIEPKSNKSYIHVEYNYALNNNIPVMGIVLSDEAIENKKQELGEKNAIELDNKDKYQDFKDKVLSKICEKVNGPEEVKTAIIASLSDIQERKADELDGWICGRNIPDYEELKNENIKLRKKTKKLKSGIDKIHKSNINETVNRIESKLIKKISNMAQEDHSANDQENMSEQDTESNQEDNVLNVGNDFVEKVIERFKIVFEEHGISINQMPFFIDNRFNLNLSDFRNDNTILKIIDDDLLNWVSNKFGIKREWLDGVSEQIYENKDYYKRVDLLIDLLVEFKSKHGKNFDMFILKTDDLDRKNDADQSVIIVLRVPIGELHNNTIYRYIPVSTLWKWGYWRTRYQLKSIFWVCKKLNIYTDGYDIKEKEKKKIVNKTVFPQEILNQIPLSYTWYTEDYVDSPKESAVAKESEELDDIHKYIKDKRYDKILKRACEEHDLKIDINEL